MTLAGAHISDPLPLRPQPTGDQASEILKVQQALLAKAQAGAFPKNAVPFWHSMTVDENLNVGTAQMYVAWAEKLVRLADARIQVEAPTAELQVLRIGRGGLASFPGEVFMELGLRIRKAFHDKPVMVAGYTNGSIGYIPTQEAFAEGGYEATSAQRVRVIPIAVDGGDRLTDQVIGLMNDIFENGRSG